MKYDFRDRADDRMFSLSKKLKVRQFGGGEVEEAEVDGRLQAFGVGYDLIGTVEAFLEEKRVGAAHGSLINATWSRISPMVDESTTRQR